MFVTILTVLYAAVPVVSAIGWVPQIARLVRKPALAAGMSVATWGTWTVTGVIGLLYSLVVVQDVLVTVFYAVNATGQAVVFTYALYARMKHLDAGDR